jgi:hypothetical protein
MEIQKSALGPTDSERCVQVLTETTCAPANLAQTESIQSVSKLRSTRSLQLVVASAPLYRISTVDRTTILYRYHFMHYAGLAIDRFEISFYCCQLDSMKNEAVRLHSKVRLPVSLTAMRWAQTAISNSSKHSAEVIWISPSASNRPAPAMQGTTNTLLTAD